MLEMLKLKIVSQILTRSSRTSLDKVIYTKCNAKCNIENNRYNEGGIASCLLDETAKM